MRRFARPYAEALLASAGSPEEAAAVRDELAALAAAMERVPTLAKVVANPAVGPDEKEKAVARVTEQAGFRPLTRRLVQALLRRGRLPRLGEVVTALDEALRAAAGVAVAEVTTAHPLGEDDRRRLARVLGDKVGKRVELAVEVDPGLLGGFVARVGSYRWDASLRGQLDRLAADLAEA